ncbi:polysaccharide lyase 8 family protein [uncultured Lactococcus sp.]|uniref:polysaccharide lyase 8 family protein n=1 Tax=uncultured Lactococcus sp. TaxID=167973 RepID=UPI0027DCBDEE|nr:polysaccharide lyase 8 family protein [uncultured Lactococcus sp.]
MTKKLFYFIAFLLVSISLSFTFSQRATAESYTSDFSNQLGTWEDLVGKADRKTSQGQLNIANQKLSTGYESISLNTDAGNRSSGDVQITFVYNGQTNFGLVFRAGAGNTKNYQSFAYMSNGNWQLGQPGGKWITDIHSQSLEIGQTYKLLLRYQGTSVKAYLNGQIIYDNPHVTYSDGSTINGDWTGSTGLRLFGNLSQLSLLSLKAGEVNSIPEVLDTQQFISLRDKWKQQLITENYDSNNAPLVKYVNTLSKNAQTLYQSMNRSPNRQELWPLKAGDTPSANLTTHFSNLYLLSQAYGTKGTDYYLNSELLADIQSGLDFMVSQKGYDGQKYYGNWWDWQVGIPQKFIGSLVILGDKLPSDKIQEYTKAIQSYVPNPYQQLYTKAQDVFVDLAFIPNFSTTGANRTDLALSVLGLGILQEDESKIELASNSIKEVFQTVTKGDGFYPDGSFIQHNNIPYTGSYGNVLVKGVGQILATTKDSSFEMDSQTVSNFVSTVEQSFIPLIYQGTMLPGVNGRSISRAPKDTQVGYGSTTMYNLLIVANLSSEESQKKLQEAVKYWMQTNPDYYLNNTRDYNDLQLTLSLMANTTITGDMLPFMGTKVFASMDRFVQSNPTYMTSLSLYSNRTSSFEAGNGENKRGWHTADGMFYLYNNDGVQFGNSYWPTVDPYRLPGTTVDTVALQDENSSFTTVTSPETWVGGAAAENQAVMGMALNKQGTKNNGTVLPMNLRAKKSWFVLEDQTIALGAGISGDTTASIETVVDNHLLNDAYHYQVISNKGNITVASEESEKDWLLLQSDHQNASIGYYFPTSSDVTVQSEKRTGTYAAINSAFPSDKTYSGEYRKFMINHGQHPQNANYSYVILPEATQEKLKNYTQDNTLKILANTESIQAVQMETAGYLGINFWAATGGSIADITTDKPISLLKQTKQTQTNETAHIQLPKDFKHILSMSDGVSFDEATHTLIIDFSGSVGSAKQIVVE